MTKNGERQKDEKSSDMRLYEDWPSNNKFHCKGRLIYGPDRLYFALSALGVIGGGALFVAGTTPELLRGDVLPPVWTYLFLPVFLILWFVAISSHFAVAYMDPGIIPRAPAPSLPDTTDPYRIAASQPAASKVITVNKIPVTLKWCPTCNIYRPPRSTHCSTCDNCVYKMDHHCPYIGNCVGQRNYREFIYFIFSIFFTSLFAVPHAIALVLTRSMREGGFSVAFFETSFTPWAFTASIVVIVLGAATVLMVGLLISFTCRMISRGTTTNENIKHGDIALHNPYSKGCCRNWIYACCSSRFPRSVFPRVRVNENNELIDDEGKLLSSDALQKADLESGH
jgi:palmitoyltransferase ZDHHC9/14/18